MHSETGLGQNLFILPQRFSLIRPRLLVVHTTYHIPSFLYLVVSLSVWVLSRRGTGWVVVVVVPGESGDDGCRDLDW